MQLACYICDRNWFGRWVLIQSISFVSVSILTNILHLLVGRYDCCEYTVERKTKEYVRLIQSFKEELIRWEGFDPRLVFQFTVDCANYLTNEFRLDPSSGWYDHKSHSAGVKYEYACHLYESKCVSMRGPFPCGIPDISIFRGGDSKKKSERDENALFFKIPKGK